MQEKREAASETCEDLKSSVLTCPKRFSLQVRHRSEQLRLALLEILGGKEMQKVDTSKLPKPSQ